MNPTDRLQSLIKQQEELQALIQEERRRSLIGQSLQDDTQTLHAVREKAKLDGWVTELDSMTLAEFCLAVYPGRARAKAVTERSARLTPGEVQQVQETILETLRQNELGLTISQLFKTAQEKLPLISLDQKKVRAQLISLSKAEQVRIKPGPSRKAGNVYTPAVVSIKQKSKR